MAFGYPVSLVLSDREMPGRELGVPLARRSAKGFLELTSRGDQAWVLSGDVVRED
jgi:hypothetical protein